MKQLTYSLKARTPEKHSAYRPEELAGMTLLQLRDICEREKIVHAAVNRMDREELIHLILRFRGGRTVSAPVIKCRKTPNKKCRKMAEVKKK